MLGEALAKQARNSSLHERGVRHTTVHSMSSFLALWKPNSRAGWLDLCTLKTNSFT